ncbi:MAG: hypothetical protein MPJ50_01020 [Pirellulales bacterium]|nr:hypothetical protein [Pirellulales bacterium]
MTSSLASDLHDSACAPGSPEWLEEVRAEMAVAWESLGRGKLEGCEIVESIKRSYSQVHVLEIQSPAGRAQAVAKSTVRDPINKPSWSREIQASVEFEILEHLHARFDPLPGLAVPRPICVLPERDTFIMDFVPGSLLAESHSALRWFSPRLAFKMMGSDYQRLGTWLAKFQEFTKPEQGDASHLQGIEGRIRLRLERIQQAQDRRIPSHLVATAERRLKSLLDEAAGESIPIAGRHGDFGPWNSIVSDDQASGRDVSREIVVFDFMGYAREPRPLDAINVLYFLEHESQSIVTSPRRARDVQQRFLYGYASQEVYSRPLLVLCEFHARVYSIWGCLSMPTDRRHHKWQQNKSLRRNIAWLLDERAPGVWQDLQSRTRIKA